MPYLKIMSHEERENIPTNQNSSKSTIYGIAKERGFSGGILCCLQMSLPQQLRRIVLKGQQEIMCSDGDVYGRKLFHFPYLTSSLETGGTFGSICFILSQVGSGCAGRQFKSRVLTEGKHSIICNATCDPRHSFQIGRFRTALRMEVVLLKHPIIKSLQICWKNQGVKVVLRLWNSLAVREALDLNL